MCWPGGCRPPGPGRTTSACWGRSACRSPWATPSRPSSRSRPSSPAPTTTTAPPPPSTAWPAPAARRPSADLAPAGDRELALDGSAADPIGQVEQVHTGAGVARDHLEPLPDPEAAVAVEV